jgi:hypothetical protein
LLNNEAPYQKIEAGRSYGPAAGMDGARGTPVKILPGIEIDIQSCADLSGQGPVANALGQV